jgi:hypothetical protein
MAEPTTLPGEDPKLTRVLRNERGTSIGMLQSFVDVAELKRLMGQLTVVELLRMMISERVPAVATVSARTSPV